MELVLYTVVMMLLVGFPLGLLLGTLDEYSTRFSPEAVRPARSVLQPRPIHRAHARWRRLAQRTRVRGEPLVRDEAGLRTRPAPDGEHLGADAA
jgi:hypothetical protein